MEVLKTAKTKQGNEIQLLGEKSADNVLVIGVFHGEEPQGKFLIDEYLKTLAPLPNPLPKGAREVSNESAPLPNPLPKGAREVSNESAPLPSPLPKGAREVSNESAPLADGVREYSYKLLDSFPKGSREGFYYHSHNYTNFANKMAKNLRINSTDAESILWSVLRRNNLYGYHFKRQKPIGPYIVDFVCSKEKLIIELDGSQHLSVEGKLKDEVRTKYLENLGYKVIRILDNDIMNNLEGSVEYILYSLAPLGRGANSLSTSLAPLGRGLGRGANNLLFIPCLNPDGMARGVRTNSNGVDLNRNFPTKNWELTEKNEFFGGEKPASEIETRFMIEVLEEYKPKLILTLHAPFKVVNYDGPAKEISEKISEIIGYPVEASIGYPTPGSFGTYCGIERNIPTVTLELDETCPVKDLVPPVHKIFDMLCNISVV